MPTTSTTMSVWRSGGGDTTKTTYAGSMLMVAEFYFAATNAANTAVQRSSTDTRTVVLPVGAVIISIATNAAATGGTSPTFNMGFDLYTTGTHSATALINGAAGGGGKTVTNWSTGTAGASMGAVMSASEFALITGSAGSSAPTGGSISGRIEYYVPTDGAYTA
jgi:hypothetical protein